MKITKNTIIAGIAAAMVGAVFSFYRHAYDQDTVQPVTQPLPVLAEKRELSPPLPVADTATKALQTPKTGSRIDTHPQPAMEAPNPEMVDAEEPGIDPVALAQAELDLMKNQLYEDVARDILPSLSIQTHNPVWVLEQKAPGKGASPGDGAAQNGPLLAPEAREFGMIQPPEGEIWIRIPADHASEHRDVMAQYADLYRAETGYSGTVTVMLWVGGRPHDRQQYD